MSRPFKEVKRTETLRFKVTKEEKERILKEANRRELSMSEFIRVAIINEMDYTAIDSNRYEVWED